MTQLIYKKSNLKKWLLPQKLYHGTSDMYLESILRDGLKISHEQKNSVLSSPLIYLTSSIEMAKGFAQSVAYRKKGNPIILEIDTKILKADNISFDLNISLRLCSQCITYNETIKQFNIINNISDIPYASMIFDEPTNLTIPVVWDMNEKRTLDHLKTIGYKEETIENKIMKVKKLF